MNPKSVNDLDPKLKETYERVMGTSFGSNPTPPAPTMETQPIEQNVTQPAPEQSPEPQMQVETPTASTNQETTVSQVFRADESTKSPDTTTVNPPSKNETTTKTNKSKSMLIIIGVGAVIFFVAYAVLWAKLLGLF